MDFLILLAFILYFVLVLAIGLYFWNKTHGLSDYVLGGRSMNPYVTAMSAQASDMSGWLLLGLPGSIYLYGIGEIWIGIGLAIGSYCAWFFIAKRLRKYSEISGNSLTISEFFSNRFKDTKGYLQLISALVIIVFFTFYVTSGFVAGGNVFLGIFGDEIKYEYAVIITALVIILYTFMGGFKAICWTDFVQAILMLVAIVVVPLAAIGAIDGGWDAITTFVNSEVTNFTNLLWDNGSPITAVTLISCLAWGLGYFGMPHIIVRYMAIKDPEQVRVARRVGTIWIVIALIFAALIGLVGRAYYPDISNSETIFIAMVGGIFAPLVAGVLYAALMAAVMSTADSQLLVASSAVTNDLYGRYSRKKGKPINDNKLMWLSRLAVVIIAIVAAVLAMDQNTSIMKLVSFAWAGFGAAFGPIVILALFWKRINTKGALAGMIVGFVTVILWNTFLVAEGIIPKLLGMDCCLWASGIYELLPGFILTAIVAIVVSLLTEEPSQEICEEFDKATEGKFY